MVNAACLNVGTAAHVACTDSSNVYCEIATDLVLAITPIVYILFATGGVKAIDGVVKLIDLAVGSIAYCTNQFAQKKLQQANDPGDAELLLPAANRAEVEKPPSRWRQTVKGWESVSKTAKCFCAAALCICIAYPLLRLTGVLSASCQGSPKVDCTGFKASATSGCEWINDFVIDLIKQLIQGNSKTSAAG